MCASKNPFSRPRIPPNTSFVPVSANQKPSDGERKDTTINSEREGEFCWSLGEFISLLRSLAHLTLLVATWELREAVNITAEQVAYGEDEFKLANLTKQPGVVTRTPMVLESPVKVRVPLLPTSPSPDPHVSQFECKYHSTIRLTGNPPMGTVDIVIGESLSRTSLRRFLTLSQAE